MTTNKQRLDYFTRPNWLSFDIQRGVLRSPQGTRMLAVNDDFLNGFARACEEEVGPAAPMLLKRCGIFYGRRLSRRFEAELTKLAETSVRDRAMYEFDALVRDLWHGCGLGDIEVDWSRAADGFLEVALADSPMENIGPSGHVSDELLAGIIEGFFAAFCDGSMVCVQTADKRRGDKEGSRFLFLAQEREEEVLRWVESGKTHSEIIGELAY